MTNDRGRAQLRPVDEAALVGVGWLTTQLALRLIIEALLFDFGGGVSAGDSDDDVACGDGDDGDDEDDVGEGCWLLFDVAFEKILKKVKLT